MARTTFSGPVKSDNGFEGDVTGNVTGNITGNVTGALTAVQIPSATVAATGTVQANAAAVTTGFTLVSAADGNKGVKLPAAAAGLTVMLKNNVDAALKVYPNTADKINGGSANAAVTMNNSSSAMFVAYDATDWYSIVFTSA